MLKTIRDKIWHRDFSDEELNKYIGSYQNCYYTYAQDDSLRQRSASGGSVSALMIYLLESGKVDGALCVRTVIKDGKARPEFFIARSREEIMSAQGSKYAAVYFTKDAFPLINAFDGKLVIVALPCDAMITHNYRAKHPEFDAKIAFVITLFCGHNSEPELVDLVTDKLRGDHGELTDYNFRFGHWRGNITAEYADGTQITKPFAYFSDYRNVYFFAQKKCHHCFDHFGYYCDISAGDIWSPEMKNLPIKHTALITRSEAGQALLEDAVRDGVLHAQQEGIYDVANGQARTMPFHYNVTSRARVGKLFGMKIKDGTQDRVRWNDYLVAFIALANERFSKTRIGRFIIKRMPRPILKVYIYFFKGLESF